MMDGSIEAARLDALLDLLSESGREIEYVLEGACMAPTLRSGERIVIRHGVPGVVRLGEIVAVRHEGRVLIQRVVRRRPAAHGQTLTLKGDNSLALIEEVAPGNVVGRVVAVRRPRGEARFDRFAGRWIGRARALRSRFAVTWRHWVALVGRSSDGS